MYFFLSDVLRYAYVVVLIFGFLVVIWGCNWAHNLGDSIILVNL